MMPAYQDLALEIHFRNEKEEREERKDRKEAAAHETSMLSVGLLFRYQPLTQQSLAPQMAVMPQGVR